jgi:predicted DNA-binding transcriptional regulator AlpA
MCLVSGLDRVRLVQLRRAPAAGPRRAGGVGQIGGVRGGRPRPGLARVDSCAGTGCCAIRRGSSLRRRAPGRPNPRAGAILEPCRDPRRPESPLSTDDLDLRDPWRPRLTTLDATRPELLALWDDVYWGPSVNGGDGATRWPERYVGRRDVAEAFGVSLKTVDRWVRDGAPSETWGQRMRRFQLSAVHDWLRDREPGSRYAGAAS